jgi:hypothetical protein
MKSLIIALALTMSPALADTSIDEVSQKFNEMTLPDDPKAFQLTSVGATKEVREVSKLELQQKEIDDLKKQVEVLKEELGKQKEVPTKRKKSSLSSGLRSAFAAAYMLRASGNNGIPRSQLMMMNSPRPITGVNMVSPMTGNSTFLGTQW